MECGDDTRFYGDYRLERQYDPRRIIKEALTEPVQDMRSTAQEVWDHEAVREDLKTMDPRDLVRGKAGRAVGMITMHMLNPARQANKLGQLLAVSGMKAFQNKIRQFFGFGIAPIAVWAVLLCRKRL